MKVAIFDNNTIDLWVAKSQGGKFTLHGDKIMCSFPNGISMMITEPKNKGDNFYSPSSQRDVAHKIANDFGIIATDLGNNEGWVAVSHDNAVVQYAGTEEMAAMRCFVSIVYGDDFDPQIPDDDWIFTG